MKKLSEIDNELRAAIRAKKGKIKSWLDGKLAKLSPDEKRDPRVVEDLLWIRDELRALSDGKKSKPKKKSRRITPSASP
ncbi:MAG: hypothetical protein L0215_27690 [Gemmataceae bacterium]|nr:hypothetical protein [Gemmataceae bacterium]